MTQSFDLNEVNHCVPYLGSVEAYEAYAEEYRSELQREHSQLQDAITGAFLSTKDRPIYLRIKHTKATTAATASALQADGAVVPSVPHDGVDPSRGVLHSAHLLE
jgi:hypothetical protein